MISAPTILSSTFGPWRPHQGAKAFGAIAAIALMLSASLLAALAAEKTVPGQEQF